MTAARRFAVFLFTFVIPAAAAAQSIDGRVLDAQGRPVAGAIVVAVGASATPVSAVSTGDGRFTLDQIAAGRYDVTASAPGLLGEVRGVTVDAAPVSVDVTLRASAIRETLVVSASAIDQPLSRTADTVTVLTGRDLEARQVVSLGDALAPLAGLTLARSGGPGTLTSLFTRGGESDFTLVLVDGVRANAFGGGLDLSQVPLADVERIEVVRGPQSAIFGADAIGGVVQVITRQGGAPSIAASFEGGSRDTRRATVSTTGSAGAFRWQGGGDYFADEGFTGLAPASGHTVTNDDARERQGWAGAGWRGGRGTDVQGTFRYVDTDRGAPGPYGSDPARRFAGVNRVARGTTERRTFAVRALHPWTGPASRVRQRVDVDVADFDLAFRSSPTSRSASDTTRVHARVQTDAAVSAAFGVSGGVEWLREEGMSTFVRTSTAVVPVERRVVGTFGEARWNAHDRVTVQAGLRAEHITRASFVVNGFADDSVVSVNPKVAASWLISPGSPAAGARSWTRLRVAAGTGIRPPDLFEIAFTDNPALKPERSRSVDLGVTQALAGGVVQFDAAVFFNRFDDLIISVGSLRDVSRYRTDNVSNARARGVELSAGWHGVRGLDVRAAYTFLDTEVMAIDGTAQAPSPFQVGDALVRRPRHEASLTASFTRDRLTLFTTVQGRGRTLDVEPAFGAFGGLYPNPGHTVADLGGAVRVAPGVQVYARVMNAFDRVYEEVFGFPAPGRTAFVGVRVAARR